MAVSESRKRANYKYDAKTYRVMSVKPRISEVEEIRGYSERRGESLTRFVVRSCYEQMERDGGGVVDMPQVGGDSENAQAWREFLDGIKAVDEPLGEDFDRAMSERVNFTRELAL